MATAGAPLSSAVPKNLDRHGSKRNYLSDVLASLQVANSAVVFFEFSSPWTIGIEYEVPISCTITEGSLWLTAPGKASCRFDTGDTFILPRGTGGSSYFISSSQQKPRGWITASELWQRGHHVEFSPAQKGMSPQLIQWGGEGSERARIISFAFSWVDQGYGPLIDALPRLIRVTANSIGATLLDMLARFPFDEGRPELPGFSALTAQTAQLFLVHAIRSFACNQDAEGAGWLRGFSDPKLAPVLAAIHGDPGRKWTVEDLAREAGMSRSIFAERFSRVMGDSPMNYLCGWRMHLARAALAQGNKTVTTLVMELGYQSEAAFRSAFRKATGQSPREFAKSFHDK